MSLLGSIKKLWKAKNRLRDKITPFTKQINKKIGATDSYYDAQPTYDYNVDENNIVRLGSASFNGSGHRVIADPIGGLHTLNSQQPQHVLQDTTNPMAAAHAVGPLVNSNPYTAPIQPPPLVQPSAYGLSASTMAPSPRPNSINGFMQNVVNQGRTAQGIAAPAPRPAIPRGGSSPMANLYSAVRGIPTPPAATPAAPSSPLVGAPTPRPLGLSTIRSGMNTYTR